jgi:hypothetical protein
MARGKISVRFIVSLIVQWIERNYIEVVTDGEAYGQMINSPSVACSFKKRRIS